MISKVGKTNQNFKILGDKFKIILNCVICVNGITEADTGIVKEKEEHCSNGHLDSNRNKRRKQ